jgi:hypothetical protein
VNEALDLPGVLYRALWYELAHPDADLDEGDDGLPPRPKRQVR